MGGQGVDEVVDAVGKTGYFGEEAGELELLGLDGSKFRELVTRLLNLLLASVITTALLFFLLLILIAAIPIFIFVSILLILIFLSLFIFILLVLLFLFLFLLIADFFLLVTHITIAI